MDGRLARRVGKRSSRDARGRAQRQGDQLHPGGRAHLDGTGPTRTRGRLAELERLLEARAQQPHNADELKVTTDMAATELPKDKPNRITITGLLGGLADSVRSVAVLATAVNAITRAAVALF
jgi:hypothetical protein